MKNESKWKKQKIEEYERIREEAKRDKLAIAREKKKRYGVKNLNKEENKRLKIRTRPKMKENYWKLYRGGGKERRMNLDDEREKAWQRLEEDISELEGEVGMEDEIVDNDEESRDDMKDEMEVKGKVVERNEEGAGGKDDMKNKEEDEMIGDEGDIENNEVKDDSDKEHDDEGLQEENEDRDDDSEMRGGGDKKDGMRNEMIGDEGDNEVKKDCD